VSDRFNPFLPAAPATHGRLVPKLVTVLAEGYSARQLGHDVMAGLIVGVVALPLAIAFAIASGVRPEQGLYTAVIAGFLISAVGGSRVQIGGPTGAFIVIVYAIVQKHGYEGLALATLMAGVLLIAMGVARLGAAIKFVPYPLTIGFTAGIAVIIAVAQIRDLLGLRMQQVPADFVAKVAAYGSHLGSWNPAAVAVGALSIALVVLWPRISHRVPGPLVALVVSTAAVAVLGLPVETIGSRFGAVPAGLPLPALPHASWHTIQDLVPAAFTIALLGAIESLLSALVADGMIGSRHRSNMELIAQGIANIASPLFGGIPATGAIARTATNVKNGGRTPIAGIVHAATLLIVLLGLGRWAALIPIPALAGILCVVAYNMSEWRECVALFRSPRSDALVLIVTFALTVLVDLTVALEVGMVLAAFLFLGRMASLSGAGYVTRMLREEEVDDPNAIGARTVPEGVEVFEIYGTFFFGAASKFKDAIGTVERPPRVLILRMREVIAIDATALRALADLHAKTSREGTTLILSGVHAQPLVAMERSGLLARIGADNALGNIDAALNRARDVLGLPHVPPPPTAMPTVARERGPAAGGNTAGDPP
jgi:SulP family sulfate permease